MMIVVHHLSPIRVRASAIIPLDIKGFLGNTHAPEFHNVAVPRIIQPIASAMTTQVSS